MRRPRSFPLSTPVHTFAGHRYQFVALGWIEAKAKAEAMGGRLATITSKEECEWIYATFGPQLNDAHRSSSIWLGANAAVGAAVQHRSPANPSLSPIGPRANPIIPPPRACQCQRGRSHRHHHKKRCWFDDPAKRKKASAGFLVEWDT